MAPKDERNAFRRTDLHSLETRDGMKALQRGSAVDWQNPQL